MILLGHPYTVAAGHRIGLEVSITFIGTIGETLFYDSDEFPSGVTLTTGELVTKSLCGVTVASASAVGAAAAAAPGPASTSRGQLPATGGDTPGAALATLALASAVFLRRRTSRA